MLLLVPAHPGSPGQRAVKRLLLCCVYLLVCYERSVELSSGQCVGEM